MSEARNRERTADLQASQAVFCFRGGGSVFASSCIWLCADWEGIANAGGGVSRVSIGGVEKRKEKGLPGP